MPKTVFVQANTISMHASRRDRRGGKQLRVRDNPPTRIVTVTGDIDASNVGRVSDYVGRLMTPGGALVLDLSIDVLSVAGSREITEIGEQCAENRMEWALVSSNAVQLMLRLTDANRSLPAVGSLAEALQRLRHSPRRWRPSRPVTAAHLTRC
ncbi:MAG: STAS domain-containing protein [Mycobacterium sp.]|nr:STAS domain-containing protein [Mycobacterium sp.]